MFKKTKSALNMRSLWTVFNPCCVQETDLPVNCCIETVLHQIKPVGGGVFGPAVSFRNQGSQLIHEGTITS